MSELVDGYIAEIKEFLGDDYAIETKLTEELISLTVTWQGRSYRHTIEPGFVEAAGVSRLPMARDMARRIAYRLKGVDT